MLGLTELLAILFGFLFVFIPFGVGWIMRGWHDEFKGDMQHIDLTGKEWNNG